MGSSLAYKEICNKKDCAKNLNRDKLMGKRSRNGCEY